MSATVAQIIAVEFDKDEDIKNLLKLDEWKWRNNSFNRVSLNCSLNTNVEKLKDIFDEYKENKYDLSNDYASYNFIFSMIDKNKVFENLKYYLTELQDTFVYQKIITPLTLRLKRDKATADVLYEELMHTEDSRIRVAIYSLLSSVGVKSSELREWGEQQHEYLNEYGHDIVLNRDRQLMVIVQ